MYNDNLQKFDWTRLFISLKSVKDINSVLLFIIFRQLEARQILAEFLNDRKNLAKLNTEFAQLGQDFVRVRPNLLCFSLKLPK